MSYTISSGVSSGLGVSTLFSSLGKSQQDSVNSLSNILSDYASIKNGSYNKLVKKYVAKTKADGKDENDSAADTQSQTEQKISANAAALQASADDISSDRSLFTNKVTKKNEDGTESSDYDWNAITKKVKGFISDYNSVITKSIDSEDKGVLRGALSLVNSTAKQENTLNKAGITIGDDNKLSLDTDKLKGADISTLKSLFSGTASFAGRVSDMASGIKSVAKSAAASASSYNAKGVSDYSMVSASSFIDTNI